MRVSFCDRCGGQLGENRIPEGHQSCRAARELEPPRYCVQCGRRMIVQVTPAGWTAHCATHADRRLAAGQGHGPSTTVADAGDVARGSAVDRTIDGP
jgi:hypothetical protein